LQKSTTGEHIAVGMAMCSVHLVHPVKNLPALHAAIVKSGINLENKKAGQEDPTPWDVRRL